MHQISKATEDISVPTAILGKQIDLSTVLIALDIYSYLFIYFNAMNVHFIRNLKIFLFPLILHIYLFIIIIII